jgi:hypothetical protein
MMGASHNGMAFIPGQCSVIACLMSYPSRRTLNKAYLVVRGSFCYNPAALIEEEEP